jgi:hypothetical protein
MTRIRSITVLLGAAMLAACSKDGVQTITAPAVGSFIKFYNFAVNAPSVNFYANNTKVTAVSSTSCTPPSDPRCTTTGIEASTGTAYGSAGNAGLYSTLAAGAYTFTGRIATATDNGLPVSSVATTLVDGKYYSLYQSGTYNPGTKTADAFMVEDPIPPQIDYANATVRFINASSNANPLTLYAKNSVTGDSVAVGPAVAYKSASVFVTLPGAVYNLTARSAGSNTAIIARTGVSFLNGRVYTISARGDVTVSSTTALDNTANR